MQINLINIQILDVSKLLFLKSGLLCIYIKQIKPINDINHNEINLPNKVADVAIFKFIF